MTGLWISAGISKLEMYIGSEIPNQTILRCSVCKTAVQCKEFTVRSTFGEPIDISFTYRPCVTDECKIAAALIGEKKSGLWGWSDYPQLDRTILHNDGWIKASGFIMQTNFNTMPHEIHIKSVDYIMEHKDGYV